MRHSLPPAAQFYITAPQPCPYLDGQVERKLFTAMQGDHRQELNDSLSKQGFRRSQNVLYRPSCVNCSACLSVRIRVKDFVPSKSQRRIMKRNRHLVREAMSAWATEDQYELFQSYLNHRHKSGGMADMDVFEFASMVEETPVMSRMVEYHDSTQTEGNTEPVAVCLTDVIDNGLSMVYSFFEPSISGQSPGTYMILDHVECAREAGLEYVYLGYWVNGSQKMQYKKNFSALEFFVDGKWQDKDALDLTQNFATKRSFATVAEEVSAINLPDVMTNRPVPRSEAGD